MWFFRAAMQAVMGLKRVCPACHRSQLVKGAYKDKYVSCKFCGESMPPGSADHDDHDHYDDPDERDNTC